MKNDLCKILLLKSLKICVQGVLTATVISVNRLKHGYLKIGGQTFLRGPKESSKCLWELVVVVHVLDGQILKFFLSNC